MLLIPRATAPLRVDGETDEPDWTSAARTGPFVDASGAEARPYSDARLLWDDENLYAVLYAADEDIRAAATEHDGAVWLDDAFALRIAPSGETGTTYAIDVSAAGVTTDVRKSSDGHADPSWESGIRVALDRDGTLNDASDDDEEWVVEAAIPWRTLGIAGASGTHFGFGLRRCDTPRGARRSCGAWGHGPALEMVGVAELTR